MELNNLKNWIQEDDWTGHYRYVVSTNVAYEIFVEYWYIGTPIENAKASLCVIGSWYNKNTSTSTVEREWIGEHLPIHELLEIAEKDYKENMK